VRGIGRKLQYVYFAWLTLKLARTELEFLKSLWGLGTEEEEGYRTGPPGYINWRNSFHGIDSGALYTFKNTGSGCEPAQGFKSSFATSDSAVAAFDIFIRQATTIKYNLTTYFRDYLRGPIFEFFTFS
jgi:hypothetical protein